MGKRRRSIMMILVLLIILTGCGKGQKLRFGTGNEGGMYSTYAKKLQILTEGELSFELKQTAGTNANIRLLQKGFLDAALVQGDVLSTVREGVKEEGKTTELSFSAVCGLYTEAVHLVVSGSSGIREIEDLIGKRVSIGETSSGVYQTALDILGICGISTWDMEVQHLSLNDAAEAMKDGKIDAFFFTAGAPVERIGQLAEEMDIRFLSLNDEDIRRMKNLYKNYVICTIPAGTYSGQTKSFTTLGVRAVLVVSNDLDRALVKKLTEAVFQHADEMNSMLAGEQPFTPELAVEGVAIPFHSGAAEYLKEKGVTVQVEENTSAGSMKHAGQDD